jgi:protein O-GlcNAc transferase
MGRVQSEKNMAQKKLNKKDQTRLNEAITMHQNGHSDRAKSLYEKILKKYPRQENALHALGVLLFQSGELDKALQFLSKARLQAPQNPNTHADIGRILWKQAKYPGAIKSLLKACSLQANNLELCLETAQLCYQSGNIDKATEIFSHLIQINPEDNHLKNCLAKCYFDHLEFDQAKELYHQVLNNSATNIASLSNLATIYRHHDQTNNGRELLENAANLLPNNLELKLLLVTYLIKCDLFESAEKILQALYSQHSKNITLLLLFAKLHYRMYRPFEALKIAKEAYHYAPDDISVLTMLGAIYAENRNTQKADTFYAKALLKTPSSLIAHSYRAFNANYLDDINTQELYALQLKAAQAYSAQLNTSVENSYAKNLSPQRRLTIGYISPDLHSHSVSFFFAPILKQHNPEKFKVICYSDSSKRDQVNKELRQLAHQWHDIGGISDHGVKNLIQKEGVDILVELAGYTANHRLGLMALKAAPIQISYLGYCNSTGLDAIDYRISDIYADPPGNSEQFCSEQLLRLPGGFLCYDPPADFPEVSVLPAEKQAYIRFGSFNALAKLSPRSIRLWAKIMAEIPSACLTIKTKGLDNPQIQDKLLQDFQTLGIESHRIKLFGFAINMTSHIVEYNHIDIALDSIPYNGTTTTLEALWMGVPVVGLAGDRHASRVGSSIMNYIGLPELIGQNEKDYVRIAVELATNMTKLKSLRSGMRRRLQNSCLTSARRISSEIEMQYRQIWEKYCSRHEYGTEDNTDA